MKHKMLLTILGILLCIGICTVISAYHYSNSLIEVTVTSSVKNTIRVETAVDGAVYYKDVQMLQIPANCEIEMYYIDKGDFVAAGDALLQLKETELKLAYLEKKLEVEQLELAITEIGTRGELAGLRKEIAEEELAELELLIEESGILYTSEDGYVIEIHENSVEFGTISGGYTIQWSLPVESYRPYISMNVSIGNNTYELDPVEPVYENGIYRYEVLLPELEELSQKEEVKSICYQDGMRAAIELQYISEEYAAVIPRDCIRYDADELAYVYKVASRDRNFGEEMYVIKTGVTIIDTDSTYVAVLSPIDNIVEYSNEILRDLDSVVIIEE